MTSTETASRRGAWLLRALPATALVLGLVALGAQVSPGFRHQLVLSTTHQPEPYVELYFSRTPEGPPATCARTGDAVRVTFEVSSHLRDRRSLAYEVAVDGAAQTGWVTVAPGHTATVSRAFPGAGRGDYDLSVRLPDFDQQLHAHCDAGAS